MGNFTQQKQKFPQIKRKKKSHDIWVVFADTSTLSKILDFYVRFGISVSWGS